MTFIDILIIYFACGAPFSVNAALSAHSGRSWRTVGHLAAALVLWPIAAGLTLKRVISSPSVSESLRTRLSEPDPILMATVAAISRRLVTKYWTRSGDESLYEFDGVVAAYCDAALRHNLVSAGAVVRGAEILRVVEHPDIAAGAACLARRERDKLSFQLTLSRTEFIDAVLESESSLVGIAIELATALNDKDAVSELGMMVAPTSQPAPGMSVHHV
jgi:hypothetical protein